MSLITENYKLLLGEITSIRKNNPPVLIAVSKKQPIESVREAMQNGIKVFGENRIQEGIEKFKVLKDEGFEFELHHIGPLQSGNLRKLFGLFSYTHGVTSESSLKELLKEASKKKQNIRYFLEANLTNESSKSGFIRSAIVELLKNISGFQNEYCILEGLMAMGPSNEDPKVTREVFRDLNQIRNDFCPTAKCSMGMSGDYKIAVEEGSDFVRIGTAIFGKRNANE